MTTPVGEFTGVFQVEYPAANCADAGLAADYYGPYVGLVRRDAITIAGPRAMELVYARVGGVTVLSSPEISFSMSLDKAVYEGSGTPLMNVRMTLRSTLPQPVELAFPSSQRFDFIIRDALGTAVYTWSADKQFALLFGTERFGPGERNYTLQVPLQNGQNQPLAAGKYIAEGY